MEGENAFGYIICHPVKLLSALVSLTGSADVWGQLLRAELAGNFLAELFSIRIRSLVKTELFCRSASTVAKVSVGKSVYKSLTSKCCVSLR